MFLRDSFIYPCTYYIYLNAITFNLFSLLIIYFQEVSIQQIITKKLLRIKFFEASETVT